MAAWQHISLSINQSWQHIYLIAVTALTTSLCTVGLQAGWQVVVDQALAAGCSALLDCGALLAEADPG
jgi:hypothetical protein